MKCKSCSVICPNSALYIRHYQKAHGSVPPEYSEKDLLICDLCPKMFPTERGLKHHLKTGHIHENYKFKALKKGIILLIIQVAGIVKQTKVLDFGNLNLILFMAAFCLVYSALFQSCTNLHYVNFPTHSLKLFF